MEKFKIRHFETLLKTIVTRISQILFSIKKLKTKFIQNFDTY